MAQIHHFDHGWITPTVSYALSVLGKCQETVRLPMVPVAETTRSAVRAAMVHAGLSN